jgi:hypothetical protein
MVSAIGSTLSLIGFFPPYVTRHSYPSISLWQLATSLFNQALRKQIGNPPVFLALLSYLDLLVLSTLLILALFLFWETKPLWLKMYDVIMSISFLLLLLTAVVFLLAIALGLTIDAPTSGETLFDFLGIGFWLVTGGFLWALLARILLWRTSQGRHQAS